MVFETSLIAEISTQCLTVGPWRHCAKSWRGESKTAQYFNMFLSLKCVHYFWNFLFNIFGSQVSGDSFSGKRRARNKEGLPCTHRVCFFGSSHYGVGGPCHLPSLEAAVVTVMMTSRAQWKRTMWLPRPNHVSSSGSLLKGSLQAGRGKGFPCFRNKTEESGVCWENGGVCIREAEVHHG